jgi:hypothetical protein
MENMEKLKLKIFVNETEADFSHKSGETFYFELPDNIDVVYNLAIKSETFVPKLIGDSNDERSLGIDIKTVSYE